LRARSHRAAPDPRHRPLARTVREVRGGSWSSGGLRGLRSGADRGRRRGLRESAIGGFRSRCAGRWSSLRPPRPSTVTGPGPSRTSPEARFGAANRSSSALPDHSRGIRPPEGDRRRRLRDSKSVRTVPGLSRARRLSARPETLPLLGFVTNRPSTDVTSCVRSGGGPEGPATGLSCGYPPPDALRPRGFAPPRRLHPQKGSRACCIPLPVVGFAAFH
jgi:hypothetical protein